MQNKEKTLLVTLDFPPLLGGVANYYWQRVKAMPEDEIVVLFNGCHPERSEGAERPNEVEGSRHQNENNYLIYYKKFFTKLLWPHWLPLIWHIYKIVKKEKITRLWVGQILPVGTAVWLVSLLLSFRRSANWRMESSILFSGSRVVAWDDTKKVADKKLKFFVTCHGNDLLRAKNSPRKFKLAKRILRDAEFVEANTEFTKNILINDYQIQPEKIKVVYPVNVLKKEMVDQKRVGELREKYNLQNKKILITVARLVESKGIDLVLQALPNVWQSVPDLVYLVVGGGPDKNRLTQIVDSLSAIHKSKIIFVDNVPHSELPNYYALADAFILTPRKNQVGDSESFGIVFLEAQELNLPIIASNVGGIEEAVKNYNKINFVNPENIDELTENIVKVLEK